MINTPKKILFVITQPNWGGAQRYVFDLANGLKNRGFLVTIASGGPENEALFVRAESMGIATRRLRFLVRPIRPFSDLAAFWELFKFIKKEKFDVVHLNSSKAGIIGSIAAKLAGCPRVVYTAHGFVFNEKISWLVKMFYILAEWVASFFRDKIIAVSEFDRRSALKYCVAPADKIITIHNGVDLNKEFTPSAEAKRFIISKAGLDFENFKNKKMVGAIANFYPNKGLEYLIDAAGAVVKNFPETIFFVMGDGNLRKKLEQAILARELKNNFYLLGFVDSAEKYLKAVDLFISASFKEGLPYSLIEASLAGLPVVATSVGGCPEIIKDGESGILVKPKNSVALANAILRILKNAELAGQLGKRGQEFIKNNFDIKKMFENTLKLYTD